MAPHREPGSATIEAPRDARAAAGAGLHELPFVDAHHLHGDLIGLG